MRREERQTGGRPHGRNGRAPRSVPRRALPALALALALALVPVPGSPGLSAQETVALQEAIDLALGRSPTLAQAENALLTAETGREQVVGQLLPSLTTSAGTTTNSAEQFDPIRQTFVAGDVNTSYSMGIRSNYTLFGGGQRVFDLNVARANVRGAEAQLENQRAQVIFQTKSLFFAALATRELLDVARSRVERAEIGLEIVDNQYKLGTGTRSDLLRAQLELANARQGVLQAEATDRAARFALGRQIGRGQPVSPEVPQGIGPRELPLAEDEIFRLAEEASPSVRSALESVEAADSEIKSSRTSYLPTIGLSGGYNWNNQENLNFEDGRTSWSVSMNASYPIFQGFNRDVGLQRARDRYRVAALQESDARLAARQEADRALQGLYTAEQAIAIAEESVKVAEEDLRVVSERYRVGVAIILDVLASQVALTESETALVQARFDYEIAWADLESILGRSL